MTGVGILIPDDGIEDYVREVAGLPERLDDGTDPTPRQPKRQSSNVKPGKGTHPDIPEELDDDEEAVKKAKERLGRYG
jgi:hypothetical protein